MASPKVVAVVTLVFTFFSTATAFYPPDLLRYPNENIEPVIHYHPNSKNGGPGGKECLSSASSLISDAPTIPRPLLTLEASWFMTASPCQEMTPPPTMSAVWSTWTAGVNSWMAIHGGEYTAFLSQCQPWVLYAAGQCPSAGATAVTAVQTAPPLEVTSTRTIWAGGHSGTRGPPTTTTVTPASTELSGGGPFATVIPGLSSRVSGGLLKSIAASTVCGLFTLL